jgi:hypothetical protein
MNTEQLNAEDRQVLKVSLGKTAEMAMQAHKHWSVPSRVNHDPRAPMLAHEAKRFADRAIALLGMI